MRITYSFVLDFLFGVPVPSSPTCTLLAPRRLFLFNAFAVATLPLLALSIGSMDPLITQDEIEGLVTSYEDSATYVHPGKHFVSKIPLPQNMASVDERATDNRALAN